MENQPEPTMVEFVLYNQWANQQLLNIYISQRSGNLITRIGCLGVSGSVPRSLSGENCKGINWSRNYGTWSIFNQSRSEGY